MIIINEDNYGKNAYKVAINTGTVWLQEFLVHSDNETEAVDLVADYCEEHELHGLYSDHYELADMCESDETVDEYAEAHGLTCCGNHGIYIGIAGLEEII